MDNALRVHLRRHRVDEERTRPAVAHPVLRGHHQLMAGGVGQHRHVGRRDHPRVPHRRLDPLAGQLVRRSRGTGRPSCRRRAGTPIRHRAAVGGPTAPRPRRPAPRDAAPSWGSGWSTAPTSDKAVRSIGSTSSAAEGANTVMPGIDSAKRHVEDPVVARPVVARDPGPVQHEDHRAPVQPHVQVRLVEGPAEERRVHGHHWAQPGHGHPGGRRHLVLLGDPDVVEAVGEAGLEREQPGRPRHRRGQRHDPRVLFGHRQQRPREGIPVRRRPLRRPVDLDLGLGATGLRSTTTTTTHRRPYCPTRRRRSRPTNRPCSRTHRHPPPAAPAPAPARRPTSAP